MIYQTDDNGGKKLAFNSAHAAGFVVIVSIGLLALLRYLYVE